MPSCRILGDPEKEPSHSDERLVIGAVFPGKLTPESFLKALELAGR